MTFLPIVERELRVAARRKATWRLRLWITVLALGISVLMLGFSQISRNPAGAGGALFGFLAFYIGLLCALSGVFLSSDSLSSEKREGTLGLLFLTDLKGYDVVLGKFASCGLSALYGLLALMPVMALTLVMGGVTAGEFWRFMLAAANLLFYSLAAGIWSSARHRDDRAAQSDALGVLLLIGLGTLAGYFIAREITTLAHYAPIVGAGPITPLIIGGDAYYSRAPGDYWRTLGVSFLTALLFLALAAWWLPRSWQDKPVKQKLPSMPVQGIARRAAESRRRQRVLDQNPVAWLARGRTSTAVGAWLCAALPLGFSLLLWLFADADASVGIGWFMTSWIFLLPFKLMLAAEACRFFVEARRSGAIELLVCTPLRSHAVIAGQWAALRQVFLWPAIIISVSLVMPGLYRLTHQWMVYGLTSQFYADLPGGLVMLAYSGLQVLLFWLKLAALATFGMWQGLSCKNPSHALRWTVLLGLFAPTIIYCFSWAVDIFLLVWSYSQMNHDMRKTILAQQQWEARTGSR